MQIEITPEYLASQGFSKTLPSRFWEKVDKNGPLPDPKQYPNISEPCWVWTAAKTSKGYGYIQRGPRVGGPRVGGPIHAHQASWVLHFGPIPVGLYVLHNCDRRECIRPEHLWLGTAKDNTQDMLRKNRCVCGEAASWSVLTEKEVIAIRTSLAHLPETTVAERFGVSRGMIGKIRRGESWKHVV